MFGLNNNYFQNMQNQAAQQPQKMPPPPVNAPGTLAISDSFGGLQAVMSGNGLHGDVVADAAYGQGLKGPTAELPLPNTALSKKVDQDEKTLYTPHADSTKFSDALTDEFKSQETDMLQDATKTNQALVKGGANHGAVNYSEGYGQSRMVSNTYDSLRRAWDPEVDKDNPEKAKADNKNGKILLDNYSKAFGFDEKKLLSKEPSVNGPERARLQNDLIARANGAVSGNAQIGAAKQAYDQSSADLATHKVSSVVAAGNEGNILKTMAKDSHGAAPKVSDDFFDNPLSNKDTVTVGATGEFNNVHSKNVSSYSNPSKNVSIYANGEINSGNWHEDGTSFSAPRVAAQLANVHQSHPSFSNDQALQYVIGNSTHQVNYNGAAVPVLNQGKPVPLPPMPAFGGVNP